MKPSRTAIWIACLVMLMASLAPSVSHLLAAARGVPPMLAEICGVGGARLVRLDVTPDPLASASVPNVATAGDELHLAGVRNGPPGQPGGSGHHGAFNLDHCPFCFTQAHLPALLPPTAFSVAPMVVSTRALPALFYQAPRRLFVWTSAQPRAPPLFS